MTTENDLYTNYAQRNFGDNHKLVLTISENLRAGDTLPTLTRDSITEFDEWIDDNLPMATVRRGRVNAHLIREEWAHALGEPRTADVSADGAQRIYDATSGTNPLALFGSLAKGQNPIADENTLDARLNAARLELARAQAGNNHKGLGSLIPTSDEDKDTDETKKKAIADAEKKIEDLELEADTRRVLSEVAAYGQPEELVRVLTGEDDGSNL